MYMLIVSYLFAQNKWAWVLVKRRRNTAPVFVLNWETVVCPIGARANIYQSKMILSWSAPAVEHRLLELSIQKLKHLFTFPLQEATRKRWAYVVLAVQLVLTIVIIAGMAIAMWKYVEANQTCTKSIQYLSTSKSPVQPNICDVFICNAMMHGLFVWEVWVDLTSLCGPTKQIATFVNRMRNRALVIWLQPELPRRHAWPHSLQHCCLDSDAWFNDTVAAVTAEWDLSIEKVERHIWKRENKPETVP